MVSKSTTLIFFFTLILISQFENSKAQPWIKAGYWLSTIDDISPLFNINSALFTHLFCAFAEVINPTSYELQFFPSDHKKFSNFTTILKQKNPHLSTLLSIGGGNANYSIISSMVTNFSRRKSFIDSTLKIARSRNFDGLDFCWVSAKTESDMLNMGQLFQEWREAAEMEAKMSKNQVLILTAAVQYTPDLENGSFPVDSIRKYLNWANVLAYDYYTPNWANFTAPFAALYDPMMGNANTERGVGRWIEEGLPAANIVLGLPFYGYAWTLKNVKHYGVWAAATGPAISEDGAISYKDIKEYMKRNGVEEVKYNSSYVMSYCVVGSSWIGFDDAEVVKIKVDYVKQRRLLGYSVWSVSFDDNWELSSIAGYISFLPNFHLNYVL